MNRTACRAIILRGEEVVLMHRREKGTEYYCFPGGSVEPKETTEAALLREIKEETSLGVVVEKLLYRHRLRQNDDDQLFYLCGYVSGEPRLHPESEEIKSLSDDYFEEPVWVEMKRLPQMLVYPLEIRDSFIRDKKSNFKDNPRKIVRVGLPPHQ